MGNKKAQVFGLGFVLSSKNGYENNYISNEASSNTSGQN